MMPILQLKPSTIPLGKGQDRRLAAPECSPEGASRDQGMQIHLSIFVA
jgi:hypothetical protein